MTRTTCTSSARGTVGSSTSPTAAIAATPRSVCRNSMLSRGTVKSMSPSDADFAELASEIAARCADAIENDTLDAVPDDALGQAPATLVRLFAAKPQPEPTPPPTAP